MPMLVLVDLEAPEVPGDTIVVEVAQDGKVDTIEKLVWWEDTDIIHTGKNFKASLVEIDNDAQLLTTKDAYET